MVPAAGVRGHCGRAGVDRGRPARVRRMFLRDGAPVLSRQSVTEMTRDQLTPGQRQGQEVFLGERSWGLCQSVVVSGDRAGAFGWDGGLGSSFLVDPLRDLILIVLTQRLWDVARSCRRCTPRSRRRRTTRCADRRPPRNLVDERPHTDTWRGPVAVRLDQASVLRGRRGRCDRWSWPGTWRGPRVRSAAASASAATGIGAEFRAMPMLMVIARSHLRPAWVRRSTADPFAPVLRLRRG